MASFKIGDRVRVVNSMLSPAMLGATGVVTAKSQWDDEILLVRFDDEPDRLRNLFAYRFELVEESGPW